MQRCTTGGRSAGSGSSSWFLRSLPRASWRCFSGSCPTVTASGVYRYDGTNIIQADTSHGAVETITEDREGNLWVGTRGGGLFRWRSRVVEFEGTEAGLPFGTVRSLCEDESGVLWAATQNGGLVRRRDGLWQAVPLGNGWTGARATCVLGDGRDGVWIGTQRGRLYHSHEGALTVLTRAEGLAGDTIRGLFRDRRGDLWISQESSTSLLRLHDRSLHTYAQPRRANALHARWKSPSLPQAPKPENPAVRVSLRQPWPAAIPKRFALKTRRTMARQARTSRTNRRTTMTVPCGARYPEPSPNCAIPTQRSFV